jgi:5-hydroxyisourate hydrolase
MAGISTHVLDTATGLPAEGVAVQLERLDDPARPPIGRPDPAEPEGRPDPAAEGTVLRVASTDADGRVSELLPAGAALATGTYRLTFDTGAYFAAAGVESFYPYATIVFRVGEPGRHHHVPLLLSPFGYGTYRGS